MTDQQERFVEYYLGEAKRNGAEAARLAGYSIDRARQTAHDLLQVTEIADEIAKRFKALTMSSEEAAKLLSDIAATRLNNYFKTVEVAGHEQREEYVTVLLQNVKDEIQTIREFILAEGMNKRQQKPFLKEIETRQKLALKYQFEIEKFGNDVMRLVAGRPCVVQRVELDLVAIAQADEQGLLKSYQITEFGPRIEIESPSAALAKILEYHGKMVQKHQLLGKDGKPAKMKVTLNLGGPSLK